MMKSRGSRVIGEQSANRNKTEALANGPPSAQQTSAQAIRKRRSSINVYDQPSSLNARLRQLETDMLRLDEDRTKLFDDTHSALAQFELRLNEIQAILKSRQDNAEKYVEDMKILLQAKEEFERQARQLNEKHERMLDKFTHRETTISRDIKLLKNKFELLEKNRQFKSLLQKSIQSKKSCDNSNNDGDDSANPDGLANNEQAKSKSNESTGETGPTKLDSIGSQSDILLDNQASNGPRRVLENLTGRVGFFHRCWNMIVGSSKKSVKRVRRKSNRVGSLGPASSIVGMEVDRNTNSNGGDDTNTDKIA